MNRFNTLYVDAIKEAREFFKTKNDDLLHITKYEISDYLKNNEPELIKQFICCDDELTKRILYYQAFEMLNLVSEMIPMLSFASEMLPKFNARFTVAVFDYIFPDWHTEYSGAWTDEQLIQSYSERLMNMYFCKDKTIKAFISLPFTGVEDTLGQRFEETKDFAIETLTTDDVNVQIVAQDNIDELIEEKRSSDDYPYEMGKDIEKVLKSDVLVIGSGWKNSKGCQLEHKAAELFDIKIIYKNKDEN